MRCWIRPCKVEHVPRVRHHTVRAVAQQMMKEMFEEDRRHRLDFTVRLVARQTNRHVNHEYPSRFTPFVSFGGFQARRSGRLAYNQKYTERPPA